MYQNSALLATLIESITKRSGTYHRELILAIVVFLRQKITMYNEFGVLLLCKNGGKFLAVRQVST
jgi:hypothetical protein